MHSLDTLKKLNSGKLKINRSMEYNPGGPSRRPLDIEVRAAMEKGHKLLAVGEPDTHSKKEGE
jgi:hypothetical protein